MPSIPSNWDVIVVGGGAAGLMAALELPAGLSVLLLSKDRAPRSASRWAQGGIAAVTRPEDERLHILEVFASQTDKWRGMVAVAARHGIGPEEIAVIGDEVNDLPMMLNASCAVAMQNAAEPVRAAATHVTLSNRESGVAHAIDMLLTETWR